MTKISTLRLAMRNAVHDWNNAAKAEATRKFLIENAVCLLTEARDTANRTVLMNDPLRIRATEWLVACELFQCGHGEQAQLSQQTAGTQARYLHYAVKAMKVERRAFDDVMSPEHIVNALNERNDFDIAKEQAQAEWREKHEQV